MKNNYQNHTILQFNSELSPNVLHKTTALALRCQKYDHTKISYPSRPGEAQFHYLIFQDCASIDSDLLAALAVIPYDDQTVECIAFTDPNYRRQGYFSALLEALLKRYCDYDLLFPVSGHSSDTLSALNAIGAEHDHNELLMCADLTPPSDSVLLKRPRPSNALPAPCFPHGSFQLERISMDCVCLHHVQIEESYRGRGLGSAMILSLLKELSACGIRKIMLHVSGDNAPAIAVYQKTGFRIIETLSYYFY